MTQTGYGVSRAHTEGVLKHCVESGGKNNLLPHSFEACQKVAEGLIDTLQGKRKTYIIDIPIPLEVRLLVRMLDDIHAHVFTCRCLRIREALQEANRNKANSKFKKFKFKI